MTKNDTCKRLLTAAAVLLAAAAMLHTLFVGLEIDEEYALSLGFRLVRGDRLFYSMWEPHQLSALPPALLIAAYTAVTGTTTGVLLFVRVTMLIIKAVLSVWFYRSLRATLGRTSACLLALVLFVFTPKWFLGPDYVSQQFHFTLAAFLFFYGYYAPGPQQYRGLWRVAAGAVCACFSFLAYPQSAAAAPFLLVGLWLLDRAAPRRCGALLFLVSCAVCGGAFALWLLQGMGFDLPALLARAALILNDPQYDFTAGERLRTLAGQAAAVLQTCRVPALAAAAAVLAGVLSGRGSRPAPARLLERLLWYFTFFLTLWCTAHALLRPQGSAAPHTAPPAVLAGLAARHGGLPFYPALDPYRALHDLYVPVLARPLRCRRTRAEKPRRAAPPQTDAAASALYAACRRAAPPLACAADWLALRDCAGGGGAAHHHRPRRRDMGR